MTLAQEQPHDRIFNILFQEDELTWQNIIYDLVKNEEMDEWDINITLIAQKFIERIKQLKDMDFRISGKIVLASALLLKMKTNRLLDQDLNVFDALVSASQEDDMGILEELTQDLDNRDLEELPKIIPRTPQPRKRKVSVFDLVDALEKALSVQNRRKEYLNPETETVAPKKPKELTIVMKDLYDKISNFFAKSTTELTFDQLIPSDSREDKVFTFIPLLHLDNQNKIDMRQQEHFGTISISLNKNNK